MSTILPHPHEKSGIFYPGVKNQSCENCTFLDKSISICLYTTLIADLKAVYAAADEQAALNALDTFAERWDKKYPKIS